MQFAYPFIPTMQVSKHSSLYAKKSSDYFLVQLPGPQCLVAILAECLHAVFSVLLLLSGDIETNPGPEMKEILAELGKISAGQSKLISDFEEVKKQLLTTDKTLSDLGKRMTELERHYQNIVPIRADIAAIQADTTATTQLVSELEKRLDDAENRSRRNNLIFYNLPDTNAKETNIETEELIINHCLENLEIKIDPKEIDRSHRLGRHSPDRCRPIIVRFTFYKTKENTLSNAKKLKGTDFSIGEDYSLSVRTARRHLVAFAKQKSEKFQIRFKTLHMGSKRYIFDHASQSVIEVA
ncbi:uncharacterized protein LOC144164831 [Haemaphysalis longicornis]